MKKKTQEELEKEFKEVVRAFEEAGLTVENMKRRREERLRLSATVGFQASH